MFFLFFISLFCLLFLLILFCESIKEIKRDNLKHIGSSGSAEVLLTYGSWHIYRFHLAPCATTFHCSLIFLVDFGMAVIDR